MNLLEHYIEKIINIEDVNDPVTLTKYIVVTMEVNCYGNTTTMRKLYRDIFELNKDLEKGYFMA